MSGRSPAPSGLRAYRAVLAIPGAAAFSGSGALARLPQAMTGLESVLLVTGYGGSWTLGGLVAGAFAISQGVAGPQASRLADRLGQTRVLLPQLGVHALALAVLIAAVPLGAPGWLLVVFGAVVGASLPQVGAYARARWTALVGGPALDTALAVESLIDELVFIVGPVLVGFLATAVAPAAGLLAALGLAVAGCLAFLAQRATEPPPRPDRGPGAGRPSAIRRPGLLVLAVVFLGIGAVFGLIEVGVVALAREQGQPTAAGPLLGLWASGSLVAGVAYGSVAWASPARRRFLLGVAALAGGAVLVAASAGSLGAAAAALVVAGLANAPTLITGNTMVPAVVPEGAVTEAYTWLTVAMFAGVAVGSPVGGALIDQREPGAALWAAATAGALTALIALLAQAPLRAGGEA